ncbi:hypothetical protein Zmor_010638 [Zophobas morio]|uniref:Uncharacterized protein n=1 Tax=Zophobas morio TaxID=2755281 RepID=A0AA38IPY7_9CUCU|nr:hypothetical protein Zmor_010638 [Zophobas morio]
MALFSNLECTDIVLTYGEARGSALAPNEFFQKTYQIVVCQMCALLRTLQHFRDYGSFKPAPQDRGKLRSNRIANIEEAVLKSVEARPSTSTYHCLV